MENKNLWISIAVVIVVVAGLILWAKSTPADITVGDNTTGDTALEPADSVEDTSSGSVNSASKAATISYANALKKYADARIQLDQECRASLTNTTFKNGSEIMIDNRSSLDRTVRVGSTYNIKAWGFKIVKLSSSALPATWLVDCDKSQNVATILTQK